MQRTRPPCLERHPLGRGLAGSLLAFALASGLSAAASPSVLRCALSTPAQVAAGQAAVLELELHNTGTQAIDFLVWATPFEPIWSAPYLSVRRGAQDVPYGGPQFKRGDPVAADYRRIEAGQRKSARLELFPAFDVGLPGSYEVQPHIVLHDWHFAAEPQPAARMRSQFQRMELQCPALRFQRSG